MNLKKLYAKQFKQKTHNEMNRDEFNKICRIAQIGFLDMFEILKPYSEVHRHFHSLSHILNLVEQIHLDSFKNVKEKYSFYFAALFHDVVYIPGRKDNEQKSLEVFQKHYKNEYNDIIDFELVTVLIKGTALVDDRNASPEVRRFNSFDRSILTKSVNELMEYGEKIWKEYSHIPYSKFLDGHFSVIRRLVNSTYNSDPLLKQYLKNIDDYEKIMRSKRIKVGIYAGSFNPFHIGHLDILQQSEHLFDKVILGKGINPEKNQNFNNQILVNDIVIEGVPLRFQQVQFNMLLARYVEKLETEENYDITIIRGIRNESDVHSELLQRKYSMEMNPNLKYVFLASSPGLEHISSSGIRTLQQFDEDVNEYLPKNYLGEVE